jgi:uncharacterized membrane protein YkoI
MRSALTATLVLAALIGCASGEKKEEDEAGEAAEAKTEQSTAAVPDAATAATAASTTPVAITEDKPGLFAKATVQPEQARATALAAVPGGTVTKGELEEEDGALIYSFDIAVPGKAGITEIHVDAKTGAVVKTEHEGSEESEKAEKKK